MQEFWVYMHMQTEYVKCAKLTIKDVGYELVYDDEYLALEKPIAIDPQNLPTYKKKFQN